MATRHIDSALRVGAFRWIFTRNVELGIATLLIAYVADNHNVNATDVLDLAVGTAIRKETNGYPDSTDVTLTGPPIKG
jgi:hypothetical protein